MSKPKKDRPSHAVLSTAGLGNAIIVDGEIVAWFKHANEEARDWCSENHTGRWMAWRAKPPELVPLTQDELAKVDIEAKRLHEAIQELIEPPNVMVKGGRARWFRRK